MRPCSIVNEHGLMTDIQRQISNDKGPLNMGERHCFRCGKEIPEGSLNYLVNIRIFSGFDDLILEPEDEVDEDLKHILEEIEQLDPQELENEVYEEFSLLL